MIPVTIPSIFWTDFSLSGLMFPAGSVLTTVLASIQRIPEVIVVPLDGQLHQLAGQDSFFPDILCVLLCFAYFFAHFMLF